MSRLLDEHVMVLCHDHLRHTRTADGDVYGQEPALLAQLAGAVASDSGRGSVSGRSVTGSPVDLGALDLLQSITRAVDGSWPYWDNPGMVRVDLRQKLNAWARNTTEPVQVGRLTGQCGEWIRSIRDMLEPRVKLTLAGACPECANTHVCRDSDDGSVTYQAALVTYVDHALCQACEATWEGKDMHVLAARIAA